MVQKTARFGFSIPSGPKAFTFLHLALALGARGRYAKGMYEDFHVSDRWSAADLHCIWKANMVAIATRHADAVDVRYEVNGQSIWITLPLEAWNEQKRRTGKVITDLLAAQIAGRHLKQLVEEGFDTSRERYTLSVDETLGHLEAVLAEAKEAGALPTLPLI